VGTNVAQSLPEGRQAGHAAKAMALMLDESMIKRAALDLGAGKLLVGFKPDAYSAVLTRN
jgi:arsenate reductase